MVEYRTLFYPTPAMFKGGCKFGGGGGKLDRCFLQNASLHRSQKRNSSGGVVREEVFSSTDQSQKKHRGF